jgi:crossover junction endodeoxyribonuclease RuvC
MIISIDPGLTGAIAVFAQGKLNKVEDIPTSAKTHGKGNQINATLLAAMIYYWPRIDKAIIERVGPMPKQGVTGVFGFGRSLGVIEGILASRLIPVEWVTPQKWKKYHGLIGKDKDASRTLVIEKYPDYADQFSRKKDIGRADAVLIGLSQLQQDRAA